MISRYFPLSDSSILDFEEIYYNKIPLGWSGVVDIWTYDERFFVGFKVLEGEIVGTIEIEKTKSQDSKKTKLGTNLLTTCQYYEVTYLAYTVTAGGQTTEHYETGIVRECSSGGGIGHEQTPVNYEYGSGPISSGGNSDPSGSTSIYVDYYPRQFLCLK